MRTTIGEAEEPLGMAVDDARHDPVGRRVVVVKIGEQHAVSDAGGRRAAQVFLQQGSAAPGVAEAKTGPTVAVRVDDHARRSSTLRVTPLRG